MTKKHYQARSCYALDLFCTARNERANLENEVKDIPPTFMNLDEILMQQRLSNRSKQVISFLYCLLMRRRYIRSMINVLCRQYLVTFYLRLEAKESEKENLH